MGLQSCKVSPDWKSSILIFLHLHHDSTARSLLKHFDARLSDCCPCTAKICTSMRCLCIFGCTIVKCAPRWDVSTCLEAWPDDRCSTFIKTALHFVVFWWTVGRPLFSYTKWKHCDMSFLHLMMLDQYTSAPSTAKTALRSIVLHTLMRESKTTDWSTCWACVFSTDIMKTLNAQEAYTPYVPQGNSHDAAEILIRGKWWIFPFSEPASPFNMLCEIVVMGICLILETEDYLIALCLIIRLEKAPPGNMRAPRPRRERTSPVQYYLMTLSGSVGGLLDAFRSVS